MATGATDVEAIRAATMREGNGFEILDLIEAEMSAGPVGDARAVELIAFCDAAANKLNDYPSHEARAFRRAGEIAEAQGDSVAALGYWERALALDANVGIASRARRLRASRLDSQ